MWPEEMGVARSVVRSASASTMFRGYILTDGTSNLQSQTCLNGRVTNAPKLQSMKFKNFHGCKRRAAAAALQKPGV